MTGPRAARFTDPPTGRAVVLVCVMCGDPCDADTCADCADALDALKAVAL